MHRAPSFRPVALLAALALAPLAARAAPPAGEQLLATPVSLTISGGVSMGAYEAGLLQYALSWIRTNAQRSELKVVTGASAGSVNALLSVVAQCAPPQDSPSASMFWKVWIPLGMDKLFNEQRTSRQAAFSRAWFEKTADELEEAWNGGFREGCDVVLGFSATRVEPRNVSIGATEVALTVPRVEERFLLRVQGRGPGKAPRLTNYREATGLGDPLLLPEDDRGEVPFVHLRSLLFASTAFPVAFEPMDLSYCLTSGRDASLSCTPASASHALFVDGGVFDNTPLGLALTTSKAGLRASPDGRLRWLDQADAAHGRLPPEMTFLYVETDVTAYPLAPAAEKIGRDASLVRLLGKVAGTFVATARSKNLYTVAEQMPEAREQIRATARHFPAASSPMVAFLGFFEEAFRRYDFYLGMYDAHRLLQDRFVPRTGMALGAFTFPEAGAAGQAVDWRPYHCLRALFDGVGDPRAACDGPDLEDTRILAQASLDRLYDECRQAGRTVTTPIAHAQCRAAAAGGAPPAVPGVTPLPPGGWQRLPTESEIQWAVRLLAGHGFRFKDLQAEQPDQAMARMRLVMGEVVAATAAKQPGMDSELVARAGKLGANALLYIPSPNNVWFALGKELELGYSRGFPTAGAFWSRFRLGVALDLSNPYALLSSDGDPWGLMPLAQVSYRIPGFDAQTFQLSAVARGGYLFSHRDDWGSGRCLESGIPMGSCSGWVVQGGLQGQAFEVAFLRLLAEWYEPGSRWAVAPMLGVQLSY